MTSYFDIAFTPSVLDVQEQRGSGRRYQTAAGSADHGPHELTIEEIEMLTTRDSFYLASVSETGWPYVQHRGGNVGFVAVLDHHSIGWVERHGNRQYLGTGNIAHNGRVAAIFVDYPTRTRLKLFGRATHHAEPPPDLLARLGASDVRADGAVTVDVLATDWNCPKYITPRFTEEHVNSTVGPLLRRIAELEEALDIGASA